MIVYTIGLEVWICGDIFGRRRVSVYNVPPCEQGGLETPPDALPPGRGFPSQHFKPRKGVVMTDATRLLAKTQSFFSRRDELVAEQLDEVEGVKEQGHVVVRKLLVGDEILLLHVYRKKGLIDPVHKHMDHESMGYLISGRLRLVIGGQEFIAEPGTSWMHPPGVDHFSEALEDCEQIEIKSPPRKTWTTVEDRKA